MEQELLDQDGKQIDTSKPKANWTKRLIILAGVLVLLLVVFVALLPTIISTGPGTRFVMGFVNDVIPGEMKVDDLNLGWFSGTSATGIVLNDPDGKPVVTVASAEMPNTTVLTLIQSNLSDVQMNINQPVFTISTQTPGGPTNMERALFDDAGKPATETTTQPQPAAAPESEPGEIRWPKGITFKVSILQGSFSFQAPNLEPVTATVPAITVDALDPANITAAFSADIKQGNQSGQFSLEALAKGLFDADGLMTMDNAAFDVKTDATNVPMVVVDQLASLRGKAQAMVGPMLNAKLNINGKMTDLDVVMSAKAEHLDIQGSLAVKPAGIEVRTMPEVHWTLTPQAHALLETQTTLNKPVKVDITLPKLELPSQKPGAFDFAKMAAELNMTVSDIELAVERLGTLTVSNTTFKALTDELASRATITASADVLAQGQQPGKLEMSIIGSDLLTPQGQFARDKAVAQFEMTASRVATALADQAAGLGSMLGDALGSSLNLNINGQLKNFDQNGIGETHVDFSTAMLQLKTTAKIEQNTITLKPGKLLTYQLTPQAVAGLMPKDQQGQTAIGLARTSRIEAFIDKLEVPRDGMGVNVKMTEVGLRANVDQVQVTGMDKLDRLSLSNVELSVPTSSLATPIAAVVNAALMDNNAAAGTIKATASAYVPGISDNAPEMPIETVSLRISNVATSLIQAMTDQQGEELSLAIGAALDLFEVQVSPAKPAGDETQRFQIATTLTDQDPLLDAKINTIVGIEPEQYSVMLANPATISLRLQPTLFQAYMTTLAKEKGQSSVTGNWTLVNTPQLGLRLDTMAARIPKDMSGNLLANMSAAIDATASVDEVQVQSPTGPRAYFQNVELMVKSREISRQTQVKLSGRAGQAADAMSQPVYANLMSDTTISDYLTADGQYDQRLVKVQTETRLPNMPIDLLEQFAGETKLQPIFGKEASFLVKGDVPGDTTVTLESQNANLKANLAISPPPRKLTLNEDMVASITINKELADTYLKSVHPMFNDVLGATDPTKFTLYAVNPKTQQKTIIPLHSAFEIKEVKASGQLDVTPLQMNRRGWMTSMFEGIFDGFAGGITQILSFGGKRGNHLENKDMVFGERQTYTADFPMPLAFDMNNGLVKTSQFWLSSNDLALAFEGNTNLDTKQQDFVIGIPGATLLADNPTLFVPLPTSSIFRTAIAADTIYNIGIKGPTDGDIASQVDYGSLVTQIVTSAAKLNARRFGGDAGGELVGGLTGLVAGLGEKAADTVNPKQKDSVLRNVKWTPPKAVNEFITREADKRKMLLLEENKPADQGQGAEQPADSETQEQPKRRGGGLLDGLLGG